MKKLFILSLVTLLAVAGLNCGLTGTQKGAVIGGAAGGTIGGAIGSKSGNTVIGAILGAAIGGAAGAFIGKYMDNQADEIEQDLEGATVTRVGEGIKITFDSGLLFAVNKSDLNQTSKDQLAKLAVILNKYEDTNILLEGHTDATGPEEYNMTLSRQRAEAVSGYLSTQAVAANRFTIMGYGEEQPIASNDTEAGRSENRRVEVAIYANEELKEYAEEQTDG